MTRLLGIDTGGTFTDFVLIEDGRLRIHKVLSTPHSPEQAILHGMRDLGLLTDDADVLDLVHGSTVATNAVLEGRGVPTVFITNRGFGDMLSLGRQTRSDLYELQPPLPPPPVPSTHCIETGGRLDAHGQVLEPLTASDIAAVRAQVAALAPHAVAINLLFSYLDGRFEQQLAEAMPTEVFVSCSSVVLPEYREYERGIATWLNAWIGPLVQGYLRRLAHAAPHARLAVMQSAGGTIDADQAGARAVNMLLSGPAGGLAGARFVAASAGRMRLLSFDMGGTSTDVALIDGELALTNEGRIAGYPVGVPMVDMHTIGAGGGSIARVDAGGLLQVGPASAGADPGPACYGRGGSAATVTDANLVLGRLRPEAFLGGAMPLNAAAAQAAVASVAATLGVPVQEAAAGIIRVANEHMARALRVMSVQRGVDPRELTLVSFGGAGGLHVCALADALGMRQALVPVHAGVLSALGMLVAPRERRLSRTLTVRLDRIAIAQIAAALAGLSVTGCAELQREGVAEHLIAVDASLDLRYRGQAYYLNVPWEESPPRAAQRFHELHELRYGHRLDLPIELVNVRVTLRGPTPRLALPARRGGGAAPVPSAAAAPDSAQEVAAFDREALAVEQCVSGPALITEAVSTTYLAPGWRARADALGNLVLERE